MSSDGRVAARVLGGLGINADAAQREYDAAYLALMPGAHRRGVYALLGEASAATSRAGRHWSDEAERDWLVGQLTLRRPADSLLPGWNRLWERSRDMAGFAAGEEPSEISERGRRHLVDQLAEQRGYPSLTAVTLAEAMRL